MKTTRRTFIQALSVTAASAAFARPPAAATQLPIAFSTLGCPAWDFSKILDFAAQNGFAAIELRGLQGNLDLPSHAVFDPDHIKDTLQQISSHNLRIACVSSSTEVGDPDNDKRTKGMADGRRFIDLASTLHAPYVRVFGKSSDADNPVVPDAELKKRVSAGLRGIRRVCPNKKRHGAARVARRFHLGRGAAGSSWPCGLRSRGLALGCVPHFRHLQRTA